MSVPTTPNYGLKKPDGTEKMTPAQFNYNADIIDAELYKKRVITGTTAPTTATVGVVGQFYLDTVAKSLYQCRTINGSVYTWENIIPQGVEIEIGSYTGTGANPKVITSTKEMKMIFIQSVSTTINTTSFWFFIAGAGIFSTLGYNYSMSAAATWSDTNKTVSITSSSNNGTSYPTNASGVVYKYLIIH